MGSLGVGLVLDEEDLWLAGNGGRRCSDVVDLQRRVLLAEHIDDGLLLLGRVLGRQLDIGAARRWRLNEDDAIVLLRTANHQVLDALQILVLLGRSDRDELFVHNGRLEGHLLVHLLLLLIAGRLITSQSSKANIGRLTEAGKVACGTIAKAATDKARRGVSTTANAAALGVSVAAKTRTGTGTRTGSRAVCGTGPGAGAAQQ